jgi:DNA (cytosine-5)-methyltransferase 1
VLFIGNRCDRVVEFPEPTHGPGPGLEPYGTLRGALAGFTEDEPVLMDFSPRKKRYLGLVPAGGNWRALPPEVARESMGRAYLAKGGRSGWWRRLSWDLPCPTIVTLPNHASTSMCHPDEVRVLSVGECARVQEFPDGWRFAGGPQQQMTQVGNAVPTRLGLVVGRLVAGLLDDAGESPVGQDGGSAAELPRFRRVYLSSHVRTRQWWKSGTVYLWDGPGGDAEYGAWRQPAVRTSP